MVPAVFSYRNEQVREWKSDSKSDSKQLVAHRLQLLQRWLGLSASESTALVDWNDFFPSFGAFVGPDGYVLRETEQQTARLMKRENDGVLLDLPNFSSLNPYTVVLIDWASQSIPAEELVEIWDDWETQKRILVSGPTLVPFSAWKEWTFPYFVVFRGTFQGNPLNTVPAKLAQASSENPSLLARAEAIKAPQKNLNRPLKVEDPSQPTEPLPMIPFTLEALKDSNFSWPLGVDGIEVKRVTQRNSNSEDSNDPVFLDLEEDEFALT